MVIVQVIVIVGVTDVNDVCAKGLVINVKVIKEEHYHKVKPYRSLVMIMIGCDNLMSNYSMLLSWTLLTSASASKNKNQQQTNVQSDKQNLRVRT